MDTEQTIKYLQGQQQYHEKQIAAHERSIVKLQAEIDMHRSAESVRVAQEQIERHRGNIESETNFLESVKASLAATIAGPEIATVVPEKKSKRAK